MKKVCLLVMSLVLVLALAATAMADTITFRMADNQADGTPNVEGDKKFIELVDQYTNGTVKIELHNNAVLGDESACADMLQLDTLDLCRISTNGIAPTCNAYNVFSLPYVFASDEAKYAALDGEFSAVVAVSYGKMRSASGGIVSLCGSRKITPVMVGSDFMVNETLIRSKFGVNTKRFAFPGQDVRALLRSTVPDEDATAMAMTTREELISYSYAISGARALRTACTLGLVLHIAAGLIGLLIMLALGYLGSVALLTPTNVLLYQLVWLVPGLLLTEWTRTV